MRRFDTYRERFPNARLTRSKLGVLEVALTREAVRSSSMVILTNNLSTCLMRSGLTPITVSSY